MNLSKEDITAAVDGHFTKFSDSVTARLREKLNAHPDITEYTTKIDNIQKMKQMFTDFNSEMSPKKE